MYRIPGARYLAFVLLCCACPLLGGFSRLSDDPVVVRKEVMQVYAKWDAYVQQGKVQALVDMIHPSFYAVDANGNRTNYKEAIRMMKEMLASLRDLKSRITVEHLYVSGDEVVAWVTLKSSFRVLEKGKLKEYAFEGRFAETLKKFGNSWRFVCSQMLP